MVNDVLLMQQGMGMETGTIVRWTKTVGDRVERGDILAEAEEAKSTFEVVAPCSGVLTEIVVEAGVELPVRSVLARITSEG